MSYSKKAWENDPLIRQDEINKLLSKQIQEITNVLTAHNTLMADLLKLIDPKLYEEVNADRLRERGEEE